MTKPKGWREHPDASGKAPRHKAAANKRRLSRTAKTPFVPFSIKAKPTVESITIKTIPDDDPELSWLDQYKDSTDPEEQKYYIEDQKRLASYGDSWVMYGIRAEAKVNIPTGDRVSTQQTITSGGLWGIESDSDESYFKEIEDEQLAELKHILKSMKITIPSYVLIKREGR